MPHEPTCFEIFLTKLAFRFFGKRVYKSFADSLPLEGNEQVLDFGCGLGTVSYFTAKRLKNGHLSCLDISKRRLEISRKRLKGFNNVLFIDTTASELPENRFDLVYCHFVLHDISDCSLKNVIPDLAKSLKSGGKLVFREPLNAAEKLNIIKHLILKNGLSLKSSRITDIPLMGNALESIYTK
ncbi:MAG: class I SAM-dependent methyltransferase [Acutalibacteraceae bacterium]|jgi:ubiquinone/menaquinone biosynthesis C-methylase UbiE